jgi:hypothetical protein
MGTPAPGLGSDPGGAVGAKVNVVDPDGNTFSLPENELARATAEGYRVEKPEEKAVREYVDENKGISGDLKVGLKSLASEGYVRHPRGDRRAHGLGARAREVRGAEEGAHRGERGSAGPPASLRPCSTAASSSARASKAGKVAELGILGTPRRREGRRRGR